MNLRILKDPIWRRRFFAVLAFIVILAIAGNPELSMFIPFLDATGLDMIFTLLSLQIIVILRPKLLVQFLRASASAALRLASSSPLLRAAGHFLDRTLESYCGSLGHVAWVKLHTASVERYAGP